MYGPRRLSLYALLVIYAGRTARRIAHARLIARPRPDGAVGIARPAPDCQTLGVRQRVRPTRLHYLALTAIGLLLIKLAALSSAYRSTADAPTSWRERDFAVFFQAHQMFQRDPEELSEVELDEVKRWCQFLATNAKFYEQGRQGLSDDDCRFAIDVLNEHGPHSEEWAIYSAIREACCSRLAGEGGLSVVEEPEG